MLRKHHSLKPKLTIDIARHVLYCKPHYCEIVHRYDMQRVYWTWEPHNLERMAHNGVFSAKDKLWTSNFIQESGIKLFGDLILDVCGGMSRCSNVYDSMFGKVDVLDLQPEWGELVKEK